MDVFPPLSSHLSFVWCVLHLICPFFSPQTPFLIVGLSLTQCCVTRSESISHGMWSSECFIQSLTSWTSKQLLLLFAWGRINRKTLRLWCKRSTESQAAPLSVKKETSFYTHLLYVQAPLPESDHLSFNFLSGLCWFVLLRQAEHIRSCWLSLGS